MLVFWSWNIFVEIREKNRFRITLRCRTQKMFLFLWMWNWIACYGLHSHCMECSYRIFCWFWSIRSYSMFKCGHQNLPIVKNLFRKIPCVIFFFKWTEIGFVDLMLIHGIVFIPYHRLLCHLIWAGDHVDPLKTKTKKQNKKQKNRDQSSFFKNRCPFNSGTKKKFNIWQVHYWVQNGK